MLPVFPHRRPGCCNTVVDAGCHWHSLASCVLACVVRSCHADESDGANFDAILVNDDLEACYEQLKALIQPPLRGVAAFRREAALTALAIENEKAAAAKAEADAATAAQDVAAEAPGTATAPVVTETAQAPPAQDMQVELQAQIRQKEAELDSANATKNRKLSHQLLGEIEALEAQLTA